MDRDVAALLCSTPTQLVYQAAHPLGLYSDRGEDEPRVDWLARIFKSAKTAGKLAELGAALAEANR